MDDEILRLTELERVEFNRRADIALAIVPVASAAMAKRKELTDTIQESTKKSKSYWYWAIGGVGLVIHYLISGDEFKFDAGVWLMLMTFGLWSARQFDLSTNQRALTAISEKIIGLQMTWESVIGNKDDFHRIGESDIGWLIDWEDDDFSNWWSAQTNHILMRVCDVEKGSRLCSQREAARGEFKVKLGKSALFFASES